MVGFINDLFAVDANAKNLTNEVILIKCKGLAVKMIGDIKVMADKYLAGSLQAGSMGEALMYFNNQWPYFISRTCRCLAFNQMG